MVDALGLVLAACLRERLYRETTPMHDYGSALDNHQSDDVLQVLVIAEVLHTDMHPSSALPDH